MKRFTILFVAVMCILFCINRTKVFATPDVAQPLTGHASEYTTNEAVDKLVDQGVYMLKPNFAFYGGTAEKSDITSITFSRTAPSFYDEKWCANVANTEDITGYRRGSKVIIVGDYIYTNTRCFDMFAGYSKYGYPLWSNLKEINGLELLNTSRTETMESMFAYGQFSEINGIENWDVSSVKYMIKTFAYCTNLTTLDIGNWDVSSVKKFNGMFQGHSRSGDMTLMRLDVSNWDTSSAEEMSHVFYGCSKLTAISIEKWDVSNVRTFSHMFADCYGLQSLDFSNWETLSVRSFDAFLNDCRSLKVIDVTGLDTGTCIQFSQMFEECSSLEQIIGLETWDVSNASNYAFSETFSRCYSLKEINIGHWQTSPDNTAAMFKNCNNLTYVDLSGFNLRDTEATTEMFAGCTSLKGIKFGGEAPDLAPNVFKGINTIAYYPANNSSWTQEVCVDYGGNVTWESYVPNNSCTVLGDINRDGNLNNKDVILLMQHQAGWNVDVGDAVLDVNGDGKLNNKDAILLMQYLAGWNVEIFNAF